MTLGEFAFLLDVDPKWVQNTTASIPGRVGYTLAQGQRLVIVRALVDQLGVPIPRAYAIAVDALARYDGSRGPVSITDSAGVVVASVDIYRAFAAVNAGRARLATMFAPRRRGRSPARRGRAGAVQRAAEYGLDLSLLAANLRRTPEARLRQLDDMMAFRRRVQRV